MNQQRYANHVIIAFPRQQSRRRPQTIATLLHALLLWCRVKRLLAQGVAQSANRAS